MPETPDLPTIVEACIDRRLAGVHTIALGTITAYDASAATATVQLADPPTGGTATAPLEDVRVTHPGAWANGDPCVVLFVAEDPDNAERRHGLGNALCVPIWASAGQTTEFLALSNLVDARLETIRTTWFVNTALGPSSTAAAAGAVALASTAATKVKGR